MSYDNDAERWKVVKNARFALSGAIGELLRGYLKDDARQWDLSWAFMNYYRIRRQIPLAFRHFLQRRRSKMIRAKNYWYLDPGFLRELIQNLEIDLKNVPTQQVIDFWPDGYSHAIALSHDIETREGLDNVLRLASIEEEFGFRSAWFFVSHKYAVSSDLLDELRGRGHEIGSHGFNHDGMLFFSHKEFSSRVSEINRTIDDWQVAGFRSPMLHRNLAWMQELRIDYDSSCFDVDPFQAMPGGVRGVWPFIVGDFVELPCTMPQDHTLFVMLGEKSIQTWVRKYEVIRKLRGMAMTIVHPDYMTSPASWDRYREYLERLAESSDAWKCLPSELSQWWRKRDASRLVDGEIHGAASARGNPIELADIFDRSIVCTAVSEE